mmetsp:Transcript_19192/g.47444  ORF Transcript_19192/g.47444 Transcript_19192/m.47444 type:complete len:151 (-) Transcript_19192:280-732(-)
MKDLFSSTTLMMMMLLVSSSNAFSVQTTNSRRATSPSSSLAAQKIGSADFGGGAANFGGDFDPNSVGESSIQSIEFKIYSDGRVEEKVVGVKGNNCHAVTEKINESLGKVIESAPTEELYETEVVVTNEQTISNSVSTNDGDSWEGQSSW